MKLKLKSVKIENFRSIKNMELDFSQSGHKVLVGKNESGKSNILKALSLLSSSENIDPNDKKEQSDSDTCIEFLFDIEQTNLKEVNNKLLEKFFVDKNAMITDEHSVKKFCSAILPAILPTSVIYEVKEQQSKKWLPPFKSKELENDILSKKIILTGNNWHHLNPVFFSAHPDFKKIPETVSYLNEDLLYQFTEQEKHKIIEYLSQTTLKEIYQNLQNIIGELVTPPNNIKISFPVIKWEYNKAKHDLPTHLDKNTFVSDPNTCIPLKNMFLLSGIQETDIGKEISEKSNSYNSYKNLLETVNKKTNEYIKKSWKEFTDVKLQLRSDGSNIVIGIEDSMNTFDFQQRSDGFRRLISFLLLMSVEEQISEKQQKLILIDEPEVGLHPSSAKDLRNKLIKLGKNSWVVYATHSISMIDTENIENNLIVSRDKENTTIQSAKEDGTSPAEMVYQAIGYSIYEELKQKNILLEGYTDKKILKLFMTDDSNWQNFGICYTDGVKNIKTVTSILELVNRQYFILSDSDKSAKQEKKNMKNPKYWYTYKDLGSNAITIEDFYNRDFFLKIVKGILANNNIGDIDIEQLPEDNRIESTKKCLTKLISKNNKPEGLKKEDMNEQVQRMICEIKEQCIQKMEKSDLNQEKIQKILKNFLEKISKTNKLKK